MIALSANIASYRFSKLALDIMQLRWCE